MEPNLDTIGYTLYEYKNTPQGYEGSYHGSQHKEDTTMNTHATHQDKSSSKGGGYGRFFAMIATSTVVMYGLMYLNTYAIDHVFFSQTRMWMALYMGGMMTIIMLVFMLGMYSNRSTNIYLCGRSHCFRRWCDAGAHAGNSWRCGVDEGHDPAPFHRDFGQ